MDSRSLVYRLKKGRTPIYPEDSEWVQFVKDHRTHLLENSIIATITFNDQCTYRYRLFSFLVETGRDTELLWIILWLNQLDTEMDFSDVDTLYIPEINYVQDLYQQYRSFKAKLNKESK